MRYCCFEIRTSCGSCGQPVPVNGPFQEITCPSCFEKVHVPPDIYAGFMNDFEEEYEGNAEGEGSGGTLMSGSGTYKYGVWRLTPRCSACKKPLVLPDSQGKIRCECGVEYMFYASPKSLAEKVPSLKWCISGEEPTHEGCAEPASTLSGDSLKPVVMSCPQCSGALSISAEKERIMACSYCDSEVYIPDAIWTRLHPVKKVQEWFACFDGKTVKQINSERRLRDKTEQEKALRGWKTRTLPAKAKKKMKPYYIFAFAFLFLFVLAAVLLTVYGRKGLGFADALMMIAPFAFGAVAVGTPVFIVFKSLFSSSVGPGKACREAMSALAAARGWEHSGIEYKQGLGYIRDTFRGRDIEIDPDDDYAIEIDIDTSVFYLNTDPPGYPPEEMYRFTTGNRTFDDLFPIRYAQPCFALKIESAEAEARKVLAPVFWFLDRWGPRIGRMGLDTSSVGVHITPGCFDVMDSGGKYVPAEDLESLFDDMMILAEGIDAVSSGKDPVLPERPAPAAPTAAEIYSSSGK